MTPLNPCPRARTRTPGGRLGRWLAAAALACLPLLPAWAGDWAHQKKLTLDTSASGADITEDLASFAMPVRLHSGNFKFAEAKPDGADLRFFAADGKTPLKFHIENFDRANELANVWVVLPKLVANKMGDATVNTVVMAWGNDKAEAETGPRGLDPALLFVHHFAVAQPGQDATSNGHNASVLGAKAQPAGPLGAALAFDGNARLEIAATPALKLAPAQGFTWSGWLKVPANAGGTLLAMGDVGRGLRIGLVAGTPTLSVGSATVAAVTTVSANSALRPDDWQHLAVVVGAGKFHFYLDGLPAGSGDLQAPEFSGAVVVGEGLVGELDESSLAATARSAAWVKAQATSQLADSPLFALVAEEGGGEVSYFTILIDSVTVDGWIVIALLGVMAVISVWVMVTKTMMLREAERANGKFLALFADQSMDLLTPGHPAAQAIKADPQSLRSSIYRLYAIGLHEIEKRFEHQRQAGRPTALRGAGLESIRASLDAAMLRENQKFNSGMVLLTIAISGGPFLGLLGTVVGVMITFAAIAAAGEVNVNSIAPGIAAALVATVAGLGVAIPALFGYNWLAAKIKNVSGDTQVFVDEFVTKTAELHAD